MIRGIRGATQAADNTSEAILTATEELLLKVIEANEIRTEDIASVFFTATADLDADYPAYAARRLGWRYVPLMCANEIAVSIGMPRLIRVLIHLNTDKTQEEIKHQYLGETKRLRPDLSGGYDDDRSNEI